MSRIKDIINNGNNRRLKILDRINWLRANVPENDFIFLTMTWWNIWTNKNQKIFSNKEPQNIEQSVRNQFKEWLQLKKVSKSNKDG